MELLIVNKKGEKFTVHYDECDHEMVSKHTWFVDTNGYACTMLPRNKAKQKQIRMHRMILGVTDPKIHVDHRYHNRLDNRRDSIRLCSAGQNLCNRRSGHGSSKYLGVSIKVDYRVKKNDGKYIQATIKSCGKQKHIGYFKTEEDAARAYDVAAKELHGEFASLNFPNI